MKTCPSCGTQVPEDGMFCPECGTRVEATAPEVPSADAPPVVPPLPAEVHEPTDIPPAPAADVIPPAPETPAAPPAAAAPSPVAPPAAPMPPQAPPAPPQQAAAPAPQYTPAAAAQTQPKKRNGCLIAGIIAAVIAFLLLGCGVLGFLLFSDSGSESKAMVQAVADFGEGVATQNIPLMKNASTSQAHAALDEIAAFMAEDDAVEYFGEPAALISSSWDGDDVTLTFEDTDGYRMFLKITAPDEGSTTVYAEDWDTESTQADAYITAFGLSQEDGNWVVDTVDGEALTSYLGE